MPPPAILDSRETCCEHELETVEALVLEHTVREKLAADVLITPSFEFGEIHRHLRRFGDAHGIEGSCRSFELEVHLETVTRDLHVDVARRIANCANLNVNLPAVEVSEPRFAIPLRAHRAFERQ